MSEAQQGGKIALITGASRGIGAATARLLAARGMRVVVNYRSSRDEADEVAASITSAGGEAMAMRAPSSRASPRRRPASTSTATSRGTSPPTAATTRPPQPRQ